MSFVKDLTGQTFGNFLVIEMTNRRNKKGQKFWKCKCLICAKVYEVRGDNLRLGNSSKCCGCNKGAGRGSREIV